MSQVDQTLDQAYRLIENNELQEAERVLQSLLPEHETNPDVWWLIAHATTDAEQGQRALKKVVELAPEREDARKLLEQPKRRFPLRYFLVGAAILILLMVALLALFTQPAPAEPATATSVAADSTLDPLGQGDVATDESEAAVPGATDEISTAEAQVLDPSPTVDDTTAEPTPPQETLESPTPEGEISAQGSPTEQGSSQDEPTPTLEIIPTQTATNVPSLSLLDLQAALPQIEFTSSGLRELPPVLTVEVCSTLGPEGSVAIETIYSELAGRIEDVLPQYDQVEISLYDCVGNVELRAVTTDRSSLAALADGNLDLMAFISQVRPVR